MLWRLEMSKNYLDNRPKKKVGGMKWLRDSMRKDDTYEKYVKYLSKIENKESSKLISLATARTDLKKGQQMLERYINLANDYAFENERLKKIIKSKDAQIEFFAIKEDLQDDGTVTDKQIYLDMIKERDEVIEELYNRIKKQA